MRKQGDNLLRRFEPSQRLSHSCLPWVVQGFLLQPETSWAFCSTWLWGVGQWKKGLCRRRWMGDISWEQAIICVGCGNYKGGLSSVDVQELYNSVHQDHIQWFFCTRSSGSCRTDLEPMFPPMNRAYLPQILRNDSQKCMSTRDEVLKMSK